MSRKSKIAAEEKIRAVEACIAGRLSQSEIAQRLRVDGSSVRAWLRRYKSEGADGLAEAEEQRVYPALLKQQAVEAYLSGKASQSEICGIFKIRSRCQLQEWIKVYNSGKGFTNRMSGGSRMKGTRKTTQEERIQIAKECIESDSNYGLIAVKYGVSYQQVRTWVLKYKELGEVGLEDRRGQLKREQEPRTELEKAQVEIEQLKRQLYLVEVENHVLKKLQEIEKSDALDE
ncbi:MAG: helix-turn-helix domain-containing protein [Gemmiger sp.]|nr:helix-turn-helix domain-containing protein [Gemmiger sp.]